MSWSAVKVLRRVPKGVREEDVVGVYVEVMVAVADALEVAVWVGVAVAPSLDI